MKLASKFAVALTKAFRINATLNSSVLTELNSAVKNPDLIKLADEFCANRVDLRFSPAELEIFMCLAALGIDMAESHRIDGHDIGLRRDSLQISDESILSKAGWVARPYGIIAMDVVDEETGEEKPSIVLSLSFIANALLTMRCRGETRNINFPDAPVAAHRCVTMVFLEEARHLNQRAIPPPLLEAHYAAMPKDIGIHPGFPDDVAEYMEDCEADVRNVLRECFVLQNGFEACDYILTRPGPNVRRTSNARQSSDSASARQANSSPA